MHRFRRECELLKKEEDVKIFPTFGLIALAIIVLVAVWYFTDGCNIHWTKPDNGGLTLEQKGVVIRLAAKSALVHVQESEPGPWKNDVCSAATIVLKALDGDEESLRSLGLLGTDPDIAVIVVLENPTRSTITVKTKKLLLDLLMAAAQKYDLRGWETTIADAIVVFDAFIVSGVTTEYEVWFLTREFFAGLVDGCLVTTGGA